MSLKSIPCVISLMTLLNVSATPATVTSRIGSKADLGTGWPGGRVNWISERRRSTELCLCYGYHSHSLPIIPRWSFCARVTHSSMEFPHNINSSDPITTLSVSSLHIIAAATALKVFPRPILSATSATGISVSQTHLLTMNHMAQTWCARNFFPGRPGIDYLGPGTGSSIDWGIG